MAKAKGKKAQKNARGKAKANNANGKQTPQAKKANGGNGKLAELRKEVETKLQEKKQTAAQAEELRSKAKEIEQAAKQSYAKVLVPYRAECKRTGAECEFAGGKSGPVAPRVRFLLEKTDSGIRVMIKGRPETEEVILSEALKKSTNKAAWDYVDKHVGPKEVAGNKGAGLGHRMRKLIKQN
jgi:hypothetical protein